MSTPPPPRLSPAAQSLPSRADGKRRRRDRLLAAAPALVVLMLLVGIYFSLRAQLSSRDDVMHTKRALIAQGQLFSRLKDAETGQRGYLITGDPRYLAPYLLARDSLTLDFARVKRLTGEHPVQRSKADSLGVMIADKLRELDRSVELLRAGDRAGALAAVREGEGRRVMDSIRALMGRMQEEEWRLNAERETSESRRAAFSLYFLIVGGVLAIAISFFIARLLAAHARDMEKQAALAAEGSAAKSRFLATMSHELRTPLNAILGYTDLIDSGVQDPSAHTERSYIARARTAARHLLSLIDDILTVSKAPATGEYPALEPVKIGDLINDVQSVIEPLADQKALDFEVRCDIDGQRVLIDRKRVRQILINVLANAVKFTKDGSVELVVDCRDGTISFVTRDTGRGIAEEEREKIFEPFWQAARSRHESHGGTGLGLAVSRQLARSMNGDLTVRSHTGDGAEFELTLPLLEPQEEPVASGPRPAESGFQG